MRALPPDNSGPQKPLSGFAAQAAALDDMLSVDASAKTAMIASRLNTLLSIPMLYAMASFQTLPR